MVTAAVELGTTYISQAVTSEMLFGVLNEMLALIPIAMPVAITYAGIRKGMGFLMGIIHSA